MRSTTGASSPPWSSIVVLCLLSGLPQVAHGYFPSYRMRTGMLSTVINDVAALSPVSSGHSTFKQLIDHDNATLGTFDQHYWYNYSLWGGPGYPIVFFTPGEVSAAQYTPLMSLRGSPGQLAAEIKAAVVMLEHRYWGNSTPFMVQDTEALKYLTLQNSIADLNYFARQVKLPFANQGGVQVKSNAPDVPWILMGWSYSGALTAWTAKMAPGTFWAYWASSAPVQLIEDFWQYYNPIAEGMPQNCTQDFVKVISYVDGLLATGNRTAIDALKLVFGLEGLKHDDDFAGALSTPLGEWQSNSFTSGYDYFQMCDAIQGVLPRPGLGNGRPAANYTASVSTELAVVNYASWFKNKFLPDWCYREYPYDEYRPRGSIGCLESYNASSIMYRDWSSGNQFDRAWYWMLCNEPFYYWQTGAPPGQDSIASRLITPQYYRRQCPMFFPGFSGPQGGSSLRERQQFVPDPEVASLNDRLGGWNISGTQRLLFVNGEFDPWRAAAVASKSRPGGPRESTPEMPLFMIKNGSHCQDVDFYNALANPALRKLLTEIIGQVRTWVDDFWTIHGRPDGAKVTPRT